MIRSTMRRAAAVLALLTLAVSLSAQSAAEALYRVTLNLYPGDDPAIVAAQLAGTYRGRIDTSSTDEPGAIRIHLSTSGARMLTSDPRVAHVEEIAPNDTGSTWSTGTYAYDAAGNIKTIGSDTFVYDRIGRLRSGTAGPGHSQAYTYDPFGNILTVTTDGNTAAQNKLGVNPINNRIDQSQAPYNVFGTYSSSGNMTSHTGATYVYDAVDMVKESTVDGVRKLHLYNAEDERIASVTMQGTTPQATDWTIRDAGGKVLRRFNKSTQGNWSWVEDYIYRGDSMLAAEVNTPERHRHFHPDHLGTPRLITGGGGAELSRHTYYPFGQEVPSPTPSAELKKFTGHERDSANLDYMHARYYKPYWGRFLSVDPTWESADLGKPQTWNRYAYAINNPVNLTDPDGRNALVWWLARTAAQYAARELVVEGSRAVFEGTKIYAMQVLSNRELLARPQSIPPGVMSAQDPYVIDDSRIIRLPGDRISAPPDKRGNAPIGDDGHPVEIHHVGQKPDSPLVEMTRTDHRGKGNFKPNHDNTGRTPSEIDRKSWLQAVKDYWKREWDRGRFADPAKYPE